MPQITFQQLKRCYLLVVFVAYGTSCCVAGADETTRLPIAITLSAEDTLEIFPVELKISITNQSDKAIPLASLMQSSVLRFDGKDYALHKLFRDRWDKMAAIPPGETVVVTSYSTWYGIRDFGTLGANLHGKLDWKRNLDVGDHAIAVRVGDATSKSVRVEILADT